MHEKTNSGIHQIDKSMNEKFSKEWLLIVGLFLLTAVLHILVSDFPKRMFIYSDELRYLELARSLRYGELCIHNVASDYQKILYPLLIMPAFFFDSPIMQIKVVSWINCILSASAIFPAWLLAKDILTPGWRRYFVVIFAAFMPYTLLTMTFMSEILYYPLSLWMVWVGYRLLRNGDLKSRIRYAVLFGGLAYLSYLNKEIALYYLLSYGMIAGITVIKEKKTRINNLIILLVVMGIFAVCFAVMKVMVFTGLGNSYHQMDLISVMRPEKIIYMCYALIYDGLFAMISFGVFPVVIAMVALIWGKSSHKKFLGFVLLSWIIGIVTIVYTISVREDFPNVSIRQHIRYLEPLLIPLLAYTLVHIPVKKEKKWILTGTCITVILSMLFLHRVGGGSPADHQSLAFWNTSINEVNTILLGYDSNLGEWIVKSILMIICVALAIIFYTQKNKCFLNIFIGLFCALNLVNLNIVYNTYIKCYAIPDDIQLEVEQIAKVMKALEGNVLIISPDGLGDDNRLIDTYFGFQNMYITSIEHTGMAEIVSDGIIDLNHENILSEYPYVYYEDLKHVEYIFAESSVALTNVEKLDVCLTGYGYEYNLYKNLMPEIICVK